MMNIVQEKLHRLTTSRLHFLPWLFALAFLGLGCMGRSSSVHALAPGDLGQLRSQPIGDVYFVPFDTRTVALKGDHGDTSTAAQNIGKWFAHVVAGAQLAFEETQIVGTTVMVAQGANPYDAEVMDKLKVRLRYSPTIPASAIVVTGRYLESDNVSGGARAMLGIMSGKTYTRAQIRITRGNAVICDATLDGTYLGGGFSWGYETLGANEALGRSIVEVIRKLQIGERIEIGSVREAIPNPG